METLLYLAPFRGITHLGYREAFATHIGGMDAYYAPFISGAGSSQVNPSKLSDLLATIACSAPTIPQLISNSTEEIVALGTVLFGMGYRELNWNLGCPFRRIALKKRGCGLLPYPGSIDSILHGVFQDPLFSSHEMRLSVKTRLGYRHAGEARKVMEVLNRYPLARIIVHPRTGNQLYSGKADPEGYADCLRETIHPMVYNGDICHAARFRELSGRFPEQHEWMLGRGTLINPFLPLEIRGHSFSDEEKRTMAEKFHQELWDHACHQVNDETKRIGTMKAIWHYMSGMLQNSDKVFLRIKRSRTAKAYMQAAADALREGFAGERELETHFLSLTK